MYERVRYKRFAIKQLNKRWTVPVLMTLIASIISLLFEIPGFYRIITSESYKTLINYSGTDLSVILNLYNSISNDSTSMLTTIIQVIVEGILAMACINVYIKMSRSPEKVGFGSFIEGFNNWARALLASLWKYLWVVLWTMLFVIPGIIKAISYSQMYYILTEYPEVSVTKSMRISMIITRGHKGDLFVTYLSFLGWAILCGLTLGIGNLWLTPYMNMTLINAYHAMMKEALEKGIIKPEDLTE